MRWCYIIYILCLDRTDGMHHLNINIYAKYRMVTSCDDIISFLKIHSVWQNIVIDLHQILVALFPGPRLNIKTVLPGYGNFHYKDATVCLIFITGFLFPGKTASLYWDPHGILIFKAALLQENHILAVKFILLNAGLRPTNLPIFPRTVLLAMDNRSVPKVNLKGIGKWTSTKPQIKTTFYKILLFFYSSHSRCWVHSGKVPSLTVRLCILTWFWLTGDYWIGKTANTLSSASLVRLHLLTHWDRVTHICVGTNTNIGSDKGLSPSRRQSIIWTNAGILLIGPLATNFSEILIEIWAFSFTEMRLKVSSAKWRSFCLGLNALR